MFHKMLTKMKKCFPDFGIIRLASLKWLIVSYKQKFPYDPTTSDPINPDQSLPIKTRSYLRSSTDSATYCTMLTGLTTSIFSSSQLVGNC